MGQKISRRNFLLGGLGIMAAAGLGGYGFVHTAAFGRAPRGARLDRILASPHFTQGHFENLVPVPIMPEEVDNKENRFSAMWKFLFGNKSALSPARPLVSKKTDLIALPRDEDIAVWMGHSNFYLQLGGRRILIDPTFGAYASPVWFINRAFAGSNIYTADDIPPLDVLAISHDHWDQLDYPTVMALKEKAAHVVCPLGVGEYFEQWGFDAARIHEEDWGTAIPIDDALTIHIVPSQHFSGRFLQQNLTEWCGMVFETKKRLVYYTGDGGYGAHFADIGRRFGGFNLVLAACGQYNMAWHPIHMLPQETAQMAVDVGAKAVIAGHNSKFALARHPWEEPLVALTEASIERPYELLTPCIGEAVPIGWAKAGDFQPWWERML